MEHLHKFVVLNLQEGINFENLKKRYLRVLVTFEDKTLSSPSVFRTKKTKFNCIYGWKIQGNQLLQLMERDTSLKIEVRAQDKESEEDVGFAILTFSRLRLLLTGTEQFKFFGLEINRVSQSQASKNPEIFLCLHIQDTARLNHTTQWTMAVANDPKKYQKRQVPDINIRQTREPKAEKAISSSQSEFRLDSVELEENEPESDHAASEVVSPDAVAEENISEHSSYSNTFVDEENEVASELKPDPPKKLINPKHNLNKYKLGNIKPAYPLYAEKITESSSESVSETPVEELPVTPRFELSTTRTNKPLHEMTMREKLYAIARINRDKLATKESTTPNVPPKDEATSVVTAKPQSTNAQETPAKLDATPHVHTTEERPSADTRSTPPKLKPMRALGGISKLGKIKPAYPLYAEKITESSEPSFEAPVVAPSVTPAPKAPSTTTNKPLHEMTLREKLCAIANINRDKLAPKESTTPNVPPKDETTSVVTAKPQSSNTQKTAVKLDATTHVHTSEERPSGDRMESKPVTPRKSSTNIEESGSSETDLSETPSTDSAIIMPQIGCSDEIIAYRQQIRRMAVSAQHKKASRKRQIKRYGHVRSKTREPSPEPPPVETIPYKPFDPTKKLFLKSLNPQPPPEPKPERTPQAIYENLIDDTIDESVPKLTSKTRKTFYAAWGRQDPAEYRSPNKESKVMNITDDGGIGFIFDEWRKERTKNLPDDPKSVEIIDKLDEQFEIEWERLQRTRTTVDSKGRVRIDKLPKDIYEKSEFSPRTESMFKYDELGNLKIKTEDDIVPVKLAVFSPRTESKFKYDQYGKLKTGPRVIINYSSSEDEPPKPKVGLCTRLKLIEQKMDEMDDDSITKKRRKKKKIKAEVKEEQETSKSETPEKPTRTVRPRPLRRLSLNASITEFTPDEKKKPNSKTPVDSEEEASFDKPRKTSITGKEETPKSKTPVDNEDEEIKSTKGSSPQLTQSKTDPADVIARFWRSRAAVESENESASETELKDATVKLAYADFGTPKSKSLVDSENQISVAKPKKDTKKQVALSSSSEAESKEKGENTKRKSRIDCLNQQSFDKPTKSSTPKLTLSKTTTIAYADFGTPKSKSLVDSENQISVAKPQKDTKKQVASSSSSEAESKGAKEKGGNAKRKSRIDCLNEQSFDKPTKSSTPKLTLSKTTTIEVKPSDKPTKIAKPRYKSPEVESSSQTTIHTEYSSDKSFDKPTKSATPQLTLSKTTKIEVKPQSPEVESSSQSTIHTEYSSDYTTATSTDDKSKKPIPQSESCSTIKTRLSGTTASSSYDKSQKSKTGVDSGNQVCFDKPKKTAAQPESCSTIETVLSGTTRTSSYDNSQKAKKKTRGTQVCFDKSKDKGQESSSKTYTTESTHTMADLSHDKRGKSKMKIFADSATQACLVETLKSTKHQRKSSSKSTKKIVKPQYDSSDISEDTTTELKVAKKKKKRTHSHSEPQVSVDQSSEETTLEPDTSLETPKIKVTASTKLFYHEKGKKTVEIDVTKSTGAIPKIRDIKSKKKTKRSKVLHVESKKRSKKYTEDEGTYERRHRKPLISSSSDESESEHSTMTDISTTDSEGKQKPPASEGPFIDFILANDPRRKLHDQAKDKSVTSSKYRRKRADPTHRIYKVDLRFEEIEWFTDIEPRAVTIKLYNPYVPSKVTVGEHQRYIPKLFLRDIICTMYYISIPSDLLEIMANQPPRILFYKINRKLIASGSITIEDLQKDSARKTYEACLPIKNKSKNTIAVIQVFMTFKDLGILANCKIQSLECEIKYKEPPPEENPQSSDEDGDITSLLDLSIFLVTDRDKENPNLGTSVKDLTAKYNLPPFRKTPKQNPSIIKNTSAKHKKPFKQQTRPSTSFEERGEKYEQSHFEHQPRPSTSFQEAGTRYYDDPSQHSRPFISYEGAGTRYGHQIRPSTTFQETGGRYEEPSFGLHARPYPSYQDAGPRYEEPLSFHQTKKRVSYQDEGARYEEEASFRHHTRPYPSYEEVGARYEEPISHHQTRKSVSYKDEGARYEYAGARYLEPLSLHQTRKSVSYQDEGARYDDADARYLEPLSLHQTRKSVSYQDEGARYEDAGARYLEPLSLHQAKKRASYQEAGVRYEEPPGGHQTRPASAFHGRARYEEALLGHQTRPSILLQDTWARYEEPSLGYQTKPSTSFEGTGARYEELPSDQHTAPTTSDARQTRPSTSFQNIGAKHEEPGSSNQTRPTSVVDTFTRPLMQTHAMQDVASTYQHAQDQEGALQRFPIVNVADDLHKLTTLHVKLLETTGKLNVYYQMTANMPSETDSLVLQEITNDEYDEKSTARSKENHPTEGTMENISPITNISEDNIRIEELVYDVHEDATSTGADHGEVPSLDLTRIKSEETIPSLDISGTSGHSSTTVEKEIFYCEYCKNFHLLTRTADYITSIEKPDPAHPEQTAAHPRCAAEYDKLSKFIFSSKCRPPGPSTSGIQQKKDKDKTPTKIYTKPTAIDVGTPKSVGNIEQQQIPDKKNSKSAKTIKITSVQTSQPCKSRKIAHVTKPSVSVIKYSCQGCNRDLEISYGRRVWQDDTAVFWCKKCYVQNLQSDLKETRDACTAQINEFKSHLGTLENELASYVDSSVSREKFDQLAMAQHNLIVLFDHAKERNEYLHQQCSSTAIELDRLQQLVPEGPPELSAVAHSQRQVSRSKKELSAFQLRVREIRTELNRHRDGARKTDQVKESKEKRTKTPPRTAPQPEVAKKESLVQTDEPQTPASPYCAQELKEKIDKIGSKIQHFFDEREELVRINHYPPENVIVSYITENIRKLTKEWKYLRGEYDKILGKENN